MNARPDPVLFPLATTITVGVVMYRILLVTAILAWCTACARYGTDEYDRLLQKQSLVVVPVDGSHSISKTAGFVVYMRPEVAYKVKAPQSKEFLDMLEAYLIDEGVKYGHPICAHGYKVVGSYTYHFAIVNAECAPD